jgi:cytidylate kinase
MIIAIDGPAGTGKSSATKRLAELLKFTHIDTGALYRAIAWTYVSQVLARDQLEDYEIRDTALAIEISKKIQLEFKRDSSKNPVQRIYANGLDVTSKIRTPEMSQAASRISGIPEVRASLLDLQRRLGRASDSILEGRDIGTVIFPEAEIKFFLTASVEERAKRRLAELEASGQDAPSFSEVKAQIEARDHADQTRSVAPLKQAQDAILLDTSQMTLDQVVDWMKSKVDAILRKNG